MLECAQEPISKRESLAIFAANITVVDQAPECWQCGARPESLIGPAVHQLQQLHRELDVPQPPLTEFQFPSLVPRRNMGNHAFAHGLSVGDEVLPFSSAPNHRGHKIHEGLSELSITSSRASLEHRLELPG